MLRVWTSLLVALVCCAACSPAEDTDKKLNLEGTYTITKGERAGKAIAKEEIEGTTITFTKDKVVTTGKDKKELYAATYTIDAASKPAKIKMVGISPEKGVKASGVVKLEGDTLTICYALPGGEAPTSFKTADKQQCFTLKKVKNRSDR